MKRIYTLLAALILLGFCSGNKVYATLTLKINNNTQAQIDAIGPVAVCAGSNNTFFWDVVNNPPPAGYTLSDPLWFGDAAIYMTHIFDKFYNFNCPAPGTYYLSFSAVKGGTTYTVTQPITVYSKDNLTLDFPDVSPYNVCEGSPTTLEASGTLYYYWVRTTDSHDVGYTSPVIETPPSVGTWTYQVYGFNEGCATDPEYIEFQIIVEEAAVVDAGGPYETCATAPVTLNGSVSGPVTTGQWLGGAGNFNPGRTALNAVYTPNAAEVGSTVTLILESDDPPGVCDPVQSSTSILVRTLPTVTLGAFADVCVNEPAFALSGGSPEGGTYSGPGVSGGNFTPATAGIGTHTITYTYTDEHGCTNSATNTIKVNPLPVVTLNPFASVCLNTASFALSGGSPVGGTYSGTGVSGGNFDPATAGVGTHTITYTYTDANGCTNSASKTITVNALPVVTLNPFASVCITAPQFALSGGSPLGGTYSGLGVSGGNFNPATAGAGTHTITYTYTDGNSCTNSATNTITVYALPTVTLSAFSPVCIDAAPFALSGGAPVGGTYSGTGVAGGIFNPATAGAGTHTITYTYIDGNGCSNSATRPLTVNPLPTVTLSAFAPVCINVAPFALSGGLPAGGTYSGPGVSGGNFNPATAGVGTHTITYTYTDANGCTNSASKTITVNALPVVTLNPFASVCITAPQFALSGGSPLGGTYSGLGVSGGNFNPATAGAGTHTITYTYTDGNSCTNSATNTITVYALPTVTLSAFSPVCIDAAPFALSGGAPVGGTYSGTGVAGGIFNPATAGAGTHTITYTYIDGNGCSNSATRPLTVNPLPTVTLSAFAPVCINVAPFALSGGLPAGGTYSGPGVSGGNFNPATAGAGTHTITYTYTDANGCINSATNSLTVNALPVVTLGAFADVCIDGSAFPLSGGLPVGGVYSGTGVSGGSFSPSVAGIGTHTITYTYTDGNGCSNSATNTITVNSLPNVTLSAFAPVCIDVAPFALSGGSPVGGTYSGTGVAGGNFNPSVAGVGTHTITYFYTDPSGCSNSATNTITVNSLPTQYAVTGGGSYCEGEAGLEVGLSGSQSGVTYTLYLNGNPTATTRPGTGGAISFGFQTAGTYTVRAVNTTTSCVNMMTGSAVVVEVPAIGSNTISADQLICSGSAPAQLTGSDPSGGTGSYNYQWHGSTNGITFTPIGGATGKNYSPSTLTQTTYYYRVVTSGVCSHTSNTVTITVNPPIANNSVGSAQSICYNTSPNSLTGSLPTGGNGVYNYQWQISTTGAAGVYSDVPGANSQNYQPGNLTQNSWYRRVVSSPPCSGSVSNVIQITVSPEFLITGFTTVSPLCHNSTNGEAEVNHSGGTSPYIYSWSPTGQTTKRATSLSAGIEYTVTVTDNFGCPAAGVNSVTLTAPDPVDINTLIVTNIIDAGGCNGDMIGTIEVLAQGGTPNFTYTLYDGATFIATQNPVHPASALFAGLGASNNYRIEITDNNSCPYEETGIILSEPDPLVISNVGITDALCYGEVNGTITITAYGGVEPYQYSINGNTGPWVGSNVFTIGAGDYDVWVRDAHGCMIEWGLVYVDEPFEILVSISISHITTCYGNEEGRILITPFPGEIGDYEYSLFEFPTPDQWVDENDFTGLPAGQYYPKVRDRATGCVAAYAGTTIVQQPAQITFDVIIVDHVTGCWYNTNGRLRVQNINGGAPGAKQISMNMVNWFAANYVFTGLGKGFHTVYVRDSRGCIAQQVIEITGPDAIEITDIDITHLLCFNDSDGIIQVTATGGTGTRTFYIDGGSPNNTGLFTGLTQGDYLIEVYDDNSCVLDTTVTVNSPPQLLIETNVMNISCSGSSNDGKIRARGTGGAPNYTITLYLGGVQQDMFINVPQNFWVEFENLASASNYEITIDDTNSCGPVSSGLLEINVPDPLSINLPVVVNPVCYGVASGTISITANGGTLPYTFTLYNAANNVVGILSDNVGVTFIDVAAGTGYYIEVDDANSCGPMPTAPFDVTQPDEITIDPLSVSVTSISCFGFDNGAITLSASGGTGDLYYSLLQGGVLIAGPQTVNGNFSDLAPGTYVISITDEMSCGPILSNDLVINEPDPIDLIVNVNNIACFGLKGSITAQASEGTAPYVITLSQDGVDIASFTDVLADTEVEFTNLDAGDPAFVYVVTVVDDNGCTISSSDLSITESSEIVIDNQLFTQITCNGENDGTITVEASGGQGTPTYTLNEAVLGVITSNTTGIFTDLEPGVYTVTILDESLCAGPTAGPFTMIDPAVIDFDVTVSGITCFNDLVTVTVTNVTGGTGSYSYSFDGGAFGPANIYTFTPTGGGISVDVTIVVRDENGCETTHIETIVIPGELGITLTVIQHPLCVGSNTGIIFASSTGGTPPILYQRDGAGPWISTGTFSGLGAGSHFVTVMDGIGCTNTATIELVNPEPIIITNISSVNPTCEVPGTITVEETGGTGQRTFTLTPGNVINTSGIFGNLGGGDYEVFVSDANNCGPTGSGTITLVSPSTISIDNIIIVDAVGCYNDEDNLIKGSIEILASGGNGPLSYSIDGGDTFSPTNLFADLMPGDYDIVVTDYVCPEFRIVNVGGPTEITYNILIATAENPTGAGNAQIFIEAQGGSGVLNYDLWENTLGLVDSNTTGLFEDLDNGLYTVVITDELGCSVTTNLIVLTGIYVTATPTHITCYGDNNGEIEITIEGGTPPYTISWTGPNGALPEFDDMQHITGLEPGTYSVTVLDTEGNDFTIVQEIFEPDLLEISSNSIITSPNCHNFNDGQIYVDVIGGTAPYTITLTLEGVPVLETELGLYENLSAGVYNLLIVDDHGCQYEDEFTLINPEPISYSLVYNYDSFDEITGDNIVVTVLPGGSYTYNLYIEDSNDFSIQPVQTNNTGIFTGLAELMHENLTWFYYVEIINENSCTLETMRFRKYEPHHVPCFGDNSGYISTEIYGGTFPYNTQVYWVEGDEILPPNEGLHEDNATLSAGHYQVTIIDAKGDSIKQTVEIQQPDILDVTVEDVFYTDCSYDATGSVVFTISGGTPFTDGDEPYYLVSSEEFPDGVPVVSVLNNVSVGTHYFTITDANGCTFEVENSVEMFNPEAISYSLVYNYDSFDEIEGDNIVVTVLPLGFYEYNLYIEDSNDFSTQVVQTNNTGVFTNLTELMHENPTWFYYVQIRNSNSCTLETMRFRKYEPHHVPCFGDTTGYISTTVYGGIIPYETHIFWVEEQEFIEPGWGLHEDFANLQAGHYELTIIDFQGDSIKQTVEIQQPDILDVIVDGVFYTDCSYDATGSVVFTITGGTPFTDGDEPYYLVSSEEFPDGVPVVSVLNNVSVGTHYFTITDANGCAFEVADPVDMLNPEPISYSLEYIYTSPIEIEGDSIVVAALPNTSTFWFNLYYEDTEDLGNPQIIQTNSSGIFTDLTELMHQHPTWFYYVEIINENSCTLETMRFKKYEAHPTLCFDDNTGYISTSVYGGTEPYDTQVFWVEEDVLIDAGQGLHEDNATLYAGHYEVTIIDSKGDSIKQTVVIEQPEEIQISIIGFEHPVCNGDDSGYVVFEISGGTPGYNISWKENPIGFAVVDTLFNVSAGTYQFIVTDSHGCKVKMDEEIEIIDPVGISLSSLFVYDLLCHGSGSGEISMWAEGGASPLYYTITGPNDLDSTNTIGLFSGLEAGIYDLFIEDSLGCKFVFPEGNRVVINEPTPIVITSAISEFSALECHNSPPIPEVVLQVTGGTPNYTYLWSNGQQTLNLILPPPDVYTITVTDRNGCRQSLQIDVPGPRKPVYSSNITTANCRVAQVGDEGAIQIYNVVGGNGIWDDDYNILWYYQGFNQQLPLLDGLWTISRLKTGNFIAEISYPAYSNDGNLCWDTTKFIVPYNEANDFTLTIIKEKDIFCWSENANLSWTPIQGDPGLASTTWWYNITDDPNLIVSESPTYITDPLYEDKIIDLVVISEEGCRETRRDTLKTYPQIGPYLPRSLYNFFSDADLITFNNDSTLISILSDTEYPIEVFTVHPDYDLNYNWLPGLFFNPSDQGTTTMLFTTGEYETYVTGTILNTLTNKEEKYIPIKGTATSEVGCTEEFNLKARILNRVVISNVFSPNDDGVNDRWAVPYADLFENLEVKVYNRWGAQVWSAKGTKAALGWDGKNKNGKDLPLGTYYWVVNFNVEGTTKWKSVSGSVTIIR